jgi:hypothetical protein
MYKTYPRSPPPEGVPERFQQRALWPGMDRSRPQITSEGKSSKRTLPPLEPLHHHHRPVPQSQRQEHRAGGSAPVRPGREERRGR